MCIQYKTIAICHTTNTTIAQVHNEKINITEIKISIPSNVYRSTVLADWVQLYSSGLNDAHRISLITAHFVLSTNTDYSSAITYTSTTTTSVLKSKAQVLF